MGDKMQKNPDVVSKPYVHMPMGDGMNFDPLPMGPPQLTYDSVGDMSGKARMTREEWITSMLQGQMQPPSER